MRGDGVKRFRKPLCIGLLLGALELGAAGLLAGVGRLASLDGFLVKLLAVFVAAAVVLAGFGVSLLF